MHADVAVALEIRLKIAVSIDRAEQRQRHGKRQKERAEAVNAQPDQVDRIGPGELRDDGRLVAQHRTDGRKHEQRGDDLGRDANRRAPRVARHRDAQERTEQQTEGRNVHQRHGRLWGVNRRAGG